MDIEVRTTRYFPTQDGGREVEYATDRIERFKSVDDVAAWLVMEAFDTHFSASEFTPDGYWSTPLNVHFISGMHEEHSAFPGPGMSADEWREVYDQLQTVKAA